METIALFGAAGKMGTRIRNNMRGDHAWHVLSVEPPGPGRDRLAQAGDGPVEAESAVKKAGIVVLAVPDTLVGRVAHGIVPALNPGTLVVTLDPAAPHAGQLPVRADIGYFVTHPCHPPVVNDETGSARKDFFGGVAAKQHIVCALMQGPESDYARGEKVARRMFAPVMNAHRVTVEQMAILEPAMSETVTATCMAVIREAMDEAARRGVPAEAARDFILGHINVDIGIMWGFADAVLSDGAKMAVERGKKALFRDDWKRVFDPDYVRAEIRAITAATAK